MSVDANRVRGAGATAGEGFSPARNRLPELLLVLSLLVVAGFLLQRFMAGRVLEREGTLTQQFLQSIVQAEGSEASLFAEPAPSVGLQSLGQKLTRLPGMLRLNIYSPDGTIRYSSEPNLAGIKFAGNDELEKSFTGQMVVELETVGAAEKSEHVALQSYGGSELIEAYLPLKNEAGNVFAVVEFYRRPDGAGSALGAVALAIWGSFGALALLVAFLWLAMLRRNS
jgi:hypothetical protein